MDCATADAPTRYCCRCVPGIILGVALKVEGHFFLRLPPGDAGLQASIREQPVIVTIMKRVATGHQLRRHHDGKPNLHAQTRDAALKHWWSDTDDGVGVLVDFDGLANDGGIRGEMRLPQAVADYRDRRASGLFVF